MPPRYFIMMPRDIDRITGDKGREIKPYYRLPSADEFKQARQKADNMAGVAFAKCQTRKCRDCLRMFYYPDYDAADTTFSAKLSRLASNRNYPCSRFLQAAPVHLRGNVREWMEEPFTSAGIGWNDNPAAGR
jgi:hypothetical protein